MPRIGDPHAILADIGAAIGPGHRELPRLLPVRIVYINRAHRWFLVEADLGDEGRVVLRKSGTEPLLRVMVEAGTQELCEQKVDEIIAAMQAAGKLIKVK